MKTINSLVNDSQQPSDSTVVAISNTESTELSQLLAEPDHQWLQAISNEATLPKPYQLRSHATAAILFASACSAAGSFLYVDGGEKYGTLAVVGGVTVNLTQNMLYSICTYFFIQDALQNLKTSYGRLIPASAMALIATIPSTISTYDVSNGSVLKALLNASGNLPNNVFGMYTSINRLIDAISDNTKGRLFLKSQLKNALSQSEVFLPELQSQRSLATNLFGKALGATIGTVVACAQTGYICGSSVYIEKWLDHNQAAGISLSFISMLPTLTIALLISGMDLGESAVNAVADAYHLMTGEKKLVLSTREKKFIAGLMLTIGVSTWLATYSSAVSKYLFDSKCDLEPTFGHQANHFLRFMTDNGAILYNAIMSGISLKMMSDYFKKAYVKEDTVDKQNYKINAIESWIDKAPIQKIEQINQTYFPEAEDEWKKSPSCLTRLGNRLGFWRTKPTTYQGLNESLLSASSSPKK
jgi:hypothetical protein